ncbi:15906_t:CDS:2 [Funneliformis geosporum]|uniref:866_t:CDS:1 n=1 Tax=Funneliformis geosporum TaxID=1117311 RepID=A0A9W4SPC4_9GLOM|nr:15906_t:CDS:2 [Funneliformis geosporum]CAI2176502.1 866_t:CDS:2 [Funneliformis geosporum]
MSFLQKSLPYKDIFGLTLDDSIWRDQKRTTLRSNDSSEQMLYQTFFIPKNFPHVQQKSKQVNTFFQYGFPSLLELIQINQMEMKKQQRLDLNFLPIITTREDEKPDIDVKLQENSRCYSLFQYDLLYSKRNNEERSKTQICPCCPPLDLPKPSRQIQRQMDDSVSYMLSIGAPNIDFIKSLNKTIQLDCHFEDTFLLNELADESFNVSNGVSNLLDKSVQSDLVFNKSADRKLNQPRKMFLFEEKPVKLVNSSYNGVVKLHEQSNDKSMLQSSSLTVEKVHSILKIYHSTSKGLIEKKERKNLIDFSAVDERETLDDIKVSNVKIFKCVQCDKEFPNKYSRKKHVIHDHNYFCKFCNNVSYNVRQMHLHEEKTQSGYVTISRKRRPRQKRRDSGATRRYYCCGQTFNTGREFGIHKSTHKFMSNRK